MWCGVNGLHTVSLLLGQCYIKLKNRMSQNLAGYANTLLFTPDTHAFCLFSSSIGRPLSGHFNTWHHFGAILCMPLNMLEFAFWHLEVRQLAWLKACCIFWINRHSRYLPDCTTGFDLGVHVDKLWRSHPSLDLALSDHCLTEDISVNNILPHRNPRVKYLCNFIFLTGKWILCVLLDNSVSTGIAGIESQTGYLI